MNGTTAYLWHGRLYTLEDAPADLLAHLQERGLVPTPVEATTDGGRTYSATADPATETAVSEPVGAPTLGDVAAAAGVSHLREALVEAGFLTAVDIAQASESELTAVHGVGKPTAVKLWTTARDLLLQHGVELADLLFNQIEDSDQ